MTKPTRWHVHTAKTPPSLIRVFAVRMKKAWVLSYPMSAQQRLWSDWVDAQVYPSLRWAHTHFVGFVMRWLKRFHIVLGIGQDIHHWQSESLNWLIIDRTIENYGTLMCILKFFVYFRVIKWTGSNYRLLKLTGETNLTSIFNNRFITMTNVWVWAWNLKPWCTDVQRHMHCGEAAEVKSWHLSPTIPSLMGGQGYKWLV